nr:unnamed protein product [Leishmania braziliensis]
MAPLAPRCCAPALLCAVLVLAAVLVRAESVTVTNDLTMSGASFNDYTMTLDLASSTADVVTVQLMNSQVSGKGLTVQSSGDGLASSARLSMSMLLTTVTQAAITFSGAMPANSDIRIVSTIGSLTSAQSLFDFSGLALDSNVTVTVENTAVTWPKDSINTGSIVLISAGSNAIGIRNLAALFVLDAVATNGASVVRVDAQSSFPISKAAVLAIDYGRCEECTGALVSINTPLVVDGSSMFRVTNCKAVGASKGLLASAGSTTVSGKSVYLVSDSSVKSTALFSSLSGIEDSSEPYSFTVSGGSTVSFLNLEAPSTGFTNQDTLSPSADSQVIGGGCVIKGVALNTAEVYKSNGLAVTTVVNRQGASGGTCANAKCIPGNTGAGAAVSGTDPCTCRCSSMDYNPPSCSTIVDPTQNYNPTDVCTVPNCITCDRLSPSTRCTQCATGYTLASDQRCILPNIGPHLCNVPYCTQCVSDSGSLCSTCRYGYTPVNGACIANANAAAGTHTVALAAVVCVAAALYAL